MCDSGAQSCCELMMLSLADASARQGLGLASLGPGSLGRAEAWSRRPACRICLESYPPLPYRQRMKRPAANAPRRRTRAAKARAGILRPSTFLLAPDAPPLMGTLDADDGGVAREVAPTAADTTASAPPSAAASSSSDLIVTSDASEDSSSSPTTLGPAPRRGARSRPPREAAAAVDPHLPKGPPPPRPVCWGPGPGLDSSGSRHWGASLRPACPYSGLRGSSFASWGYGHYLTHS